MTLNQKNAHTCYMYLYYNITLNIPTYFGPPGTITRKSNQKNTA